MWGSGSHDPGSNPGGTTMLRKNRLILRIILSKNGSC